MSAPGKGARARARRAALQVLHAMDVQGSEDPAKAFDGVVDHFELPASAQDFARSLVEGVMARREEIDGRIGEAARNWRLARMAVVDRNVLRLGAFELLFSDTPPAVVIDEAVELARLFGGDASPGFVNGVLDALAHSPDGPRAAEGAGS